MSVTTVGYVDKIEHNNDWYDVQDTLFRNTKGQADGLAELGSDGKVPSSQLPTIPSAQVQSDYTQNDDTKVDYIKNKPTLGTAAALDVPSSGNASTSQVVKGNDTRLTDARNAADVSAWAKATTKPSYTASEVGLGNVDNTSDATKKTNFTGSIASGNTGFVTGGDVYTGLSGKLDTSLKGTNNGLAELDANGLVPSTQLPSYVDDVLNGTAQNVTETAAGTYSATGFILTGESTPCTPEDGKTYVDTTSNIQYRWTGTVFVSMGSNITLGETNMTAYRGDRGKTAYDHATETKLGIATTSGFYKVAGTAQGHIASLTAVEKSDITGLGISATDENVKQSPSTDNAAYEVLFSGSADNTEHTEGVKKSNKLIFNPSTGGLMNGDAAVASGAYSHAEGYKTTANEQYSHSEGYRTIANGKYSHAEGQSTTSSGQYSHAEGYNTSTKGNYSHAEGSGTFTKGSYSHAEGYGTIADAQWSHAEGYNTTADGLYSHAEGICTSAAGEGQLVIGQYNDPDDTSLFIIGNGTDTTALSNAMTVDATGNTIIYGNLRATNGANINGTVISGQDAIASGTNAHAEGYKTSASGNYSHAEGDSTIATSNYSHAEGWSTTACGAYSHAEGCQTSAKGTYSHTEGYSTKADIYAHAEGDSTTATGYYSHAEGSNTYAKNTAAHAEGRNTIAADIYSHAEGYQTGATSTAAHAEGYRTTASGQYSHAEGNQTTASAESSHAEGYHTYSTGTYSHAEGLQTTAKANGAHAEGINTCANVSCSHAEGSATTADGAQSHAEGDETITQNPGSHAEGYQTTVTMNGSYAHTEGYQTGATSTAAHAEGCQTSANGPYSHVEGYQTRATVDATYSHAEGKNTTASGECSHTEGYKTKAGANSAHAEGQQTIASNNNSHAEGYVTLAYGAQSHAEGSLAIASNDSSHAEGYGTTAGATYSHAEGMYTCAAGEGQHVSGKYNIPDTTSLFIIGNGTAHNARSNAMTVAANGDIQAGNYNGVDVAEIGEQLDTTSHTASGNPISFTTESAQSASNPTVTLEPIQDLHGQSKPYPNGGGKNKLSMLVNTIKSNNTSGTWSGNSWAYNGVIITILTDSANNVIGFNVNGTTTADTSFLIDQTTVLPSNNYIITSSWESSQAYSSIYWRDTRALDIYVGTNPVNAASDGTKALYFYLYMASGQTYSNLKVKPMIRLATESDATFVPYSNVCPISGYDQINILGCGKNIFDINKVHIGSNIPAVSGTTISLTGGYNKDLFSGQVGLQSASAKKLYIKAGTYTVSWTTSLSSTPQMYLDLIDEETLKPIGIGGNTVVPGGQATFSRNGWICIKCVDTGTYTISNLQIEESTSATTYEPYNKITDLSYDLPETVYGGTLDVESGALTVTHGIVDLGNFIWQNSYGCLISTTAPSNVKIPPTSDTVTNWIICEIYRASSPSRVYNKTDGDDVISIRQETGLIYVYDSRYTDGTAFKAAVTGIKLVYELATPFTIQLTPRQIKLLKDYNYISSSGSTISLTYRDGQFATLEELSGSGVFDPYYVHTDNNYTTEEKTKLGLIDTLAISLDLTNHAIVVTQNV